MSHEPELIQHHEIVVGDTIRVTFKDLSREGVVGQKGEYKERQWAETPAGLTLLYGYPDETVVRLKKARKPKPAEPTGVGAVVRAKISAAQETPGVYVRTTGLDGRRSAWYMHQVGARRTWDDFVEVEIVSEGVEL